MTPVLRVPPVRRAGLGRLGPLALLALLAPSAGCAALVYAGAAGVVAVGPTMMPLAAGAGTFEMGATMLGDGTRADGTTLESGGGFRMASVGRARLGRLDVLAHGRTEVGTFGRDRLYGWTGADLGPGLRLGHRLTLGVGVGYSYGGYPQNAHNVPARLGLYYRGASVALRVSAYAGWRLGEATELAPAAAFGPGWQTWGVDGAIMLGGVGKGLSLGFTVDQQDGFTVSALTIGATITPDGATDR